MDHLDREMIERMMLEDMDMDGGGTEEERNARMMEMMMQEDANHMDSMNEQDSWQSSSAEPYGLAADGTQLFESSVQEETKGQTLDEKKDRRRTALQTETVEGIELQDLRVVSFLGAGSFGNVTLVRSTKDDTLSFALKQISKHLMVEQKMVQDCKNERQTLMTLSHPFVVHLHCTFQDTSCLYFLMEVVEGPSLHHVIQHPDKFAPNYPQPGLSGRQARFYAACLISALQHMSMKRVAHRDMKPENCVVNIDGYIKIIDFGLATLLKKGQKAMTVCGTRYYYAPEMIQRKGYTTKVDIWSLGIIIYEMFTGWTPFMSRKYKVKKDQMNEEIVKCATDGTIPYERTAPEFPAK
jgi:serine/threonine protein kinase